MNIISRFFQFLSKTDRHIISHCTDYTAKTQTAYGVFVLLTGAFAFLSCMYAVNSTFKSLKVAIPVALLYSTVIIFIDREIVSAQTKWAVFPRFFLALAIGLVISVPLEMRLFSDRIEQEIKRLSKLENQQAFDDRRNGENAYQKKIDDLQNEIKSYRQNINDAMTAMQDEVVGAVRAGKARTGKAGRGAAYEEADEQKRLNEGLLQAAENELRILTQQRDEVQAKIDRDFGARAINPVDDFLARYEAMEHVKQSSSSSFYMSWGLRALIILIEIIPALMKLFQRDNEYSAILEALRRRNLTRIYAIANDHIDQILAQPNLVPTPPLLQQLEQDPLTR
ncbi:MAG: hypothetical protein AUG51_19960 [Acidobacteria bacterium 13_1_20CM_3_53_8]|nr:MAG: hypothetical protein AUG51_19960 [Acidobacteria bacterium 13_1_20CM_3_53_8]